MTTYRPETIPPEKRRAKPGTTAGRRQNLSHTAESEEARDELARGLKCNEAEAVRRALQLLSPEAARLAEVLAERWGVPPRDALQRALGKAAAETAS